MTPATITEITRGSAHRRDVARPRPVRRDAHDRLDERPRPAPPPW